MTGQIRIKTAGLYTFNMKHDDGGEIIIDGNKIIDHMKPFNGNT